MKSKELNIRSRDPLTVVSIGASLERIKILCVWSSGMCTRDLRKSISQKKVSKIPKMTVSAIACVSVDNIFIMSQLYSRHTLFFFVLIYLLLRQEIYEFKYILVSYQFVTYNI